LREKRAAGFVPITWKSVLMDRCFQLVADPAIKISPVMLEKMLSAYHN
jgi:hypothetical protein